MPGDRPRFPPRWLLVGVLTAAYLLAMGPMPLLNDSSRDLLLGRDGWHHGVFSGCQTSFPGIKHGTLWVRLLAATFALGMGPVGQQIVGMALAVLAVVAFDRGVRRDFGEGVGWLATALFVPMMVITFSYPAATNGYLGPPLLVAATWALLDVATTGSTRAAVLGGISLAFAAELHPVMLLVLPVYLVLVLMTCDRPIRALFVGAASGTAVALILSSDSWLYDAGNLAGERWSVVLVAVALAAAFALSFAGRRRWLALDVERRRFLLLVAIVATVLGEIVAASVATGQVLSNGSAFMFPFPAFTILVALRLRRWWARGRSWRAAAIAVPATVAGLRFAVVVVWGLGVATGTVSSPNYSMRQAEVLARYFWSRGYTLPDVQRHLRAPGGFELFSAIAAFAPTPDGPLERPMRDLRVLTFAKSNGPEGPIPAGGEEVDLGFGRVAWVLPIESWVRMAPSRVCFEPPADTAAEDCVEIASDSVAYTGSYVDLHERPLPALREARYRDMKSPRRFQRFKWELPVEITGDDSERDFALVGLIATPWVIERVEGVAYSGTLPARHVVLQRGAARTGRIVLAPLPSEMTLKDYPPDFLETRPEEGALRQSLQRLPPLGRYICAAIGNCPA